MADPFHTYYQQVPPGLYRHNKTGNHYRVLFEGEWLAGDLPRPDDAISVGMVDGLWIGVHKNHRMTSGTFTELLTALWSGNTSIVVPDEHVIIYVSVDGGKGRVSARTAAEFIGLVDNKAGTLTAVSRVPRFERVGD